METLSFLDQLAMALAHRHYNFDNYCAAHELNPDTQWVKDRWNSCGEYSSFYNALSDDGIAEILNNSPIK